MKITPITIEKNTQFKTKPDMNTLGFGKYFTDHMFTAKYTSKKGWHEAHVGPYKMFEIDPGASVLHYGQALFEGMKAFRQENGKIVLFRPEFNWKRMVAGAERLCMEAPPEDLFINGIKELVKIDQDWIPKQPGSLYIRPTLIGTEAFLGVRPSDEILFFAILSPVSSYYSEGSSAINIWVETEYLRAAPGGLGATKAAANYACSLKAALEAKKKGYSQVLWLDYSREYIEEVGTMNVFFVFENEIVTPALDGTILNGGVRTSVMDLLKSWNLPIVERKLKISEVLTAKKNGTLKEAFGTGTAAVITPIGELASTDWKISISSTGQKGELSQKIYDELVGIQYGQREDKLGWLRPLQF
ncbi:MAG: branched-chain amino acid aminotransferase [Bdellovibrionaceae bacterium]|nr:branched-chain amino acid aminotransferase [Pseudobdellovibrionaceae bacterium]